jgi:peptidoglycan/xylan/chitin deacetylase (PgdA/CDA1 family)
LEERVKRRLRNTGIILSIIILWSASTSVLVQYHELKQPGIVVLLYHRITREENETNKYILSVQKFQQQLDYLKNEGYKTILPSEIAGSRKEGITNHLIILSFDDGTSDHYSVVYPMLEKNKQKGVFFIVSKYVNASGGLTAEQIKEMSENGMEIGSHSYSHPFLDQLNYEKIYYELKLSKEQLEKISGGRVYSFAPPGGWFNGDVVKAARDVGYQQFFGCEIGTNDLSKIPFIYKRIEVLGNMSFEEFQQLLDPPQILIYKVVQSMKYLLHDIFGSRRYEKLSTLL